MSDNLPPSKFGAGYTYGGDAKPAPPQYGQPPPVSPPPVAQPPVSAYGPPPAQPAYGAALPNHAAAQPSYPAPPVVYGGVAGPSGATAIIAGVLALLMGLARAWQTFGAFAALSQFSRYAGGLPGMGRIHGLLVFEAFAAVASAVALMIGAILLFSRKSAGRSFVTIGCLIVIADALVTWTAFYGWFNDVFGDLGGSSLSAGFQLPGVFAVAVLLNVGVPLLTMVLALTGATKRWCQAARPGYAANVTY